MKALSLISQRSLGLIDYHEDKELSPHDVEIDIVLTGICGTDLAVLAGREEGHTGIIRGHEAVGIVVNVGARVTQLRPGMRVVVDPNEYCGVCEACRAGQTHLCTGGAYGGLDIAGVNKHGTFAERFITREQFVWRLPEDMSWETGVLIEPLACILNNVDRGALRAGERVLLLGSGPMSLIAQILLRGMGIETLATDVNINRIEFGRSLGLDVVYPDWLALNQQHAHPFDAVIDTVGNQLDAAVHAVRRGGRILLFGFNDSYRYPLPAKHLLVNAISIIGAGEYNQHFPRALRLASRLPDLEKLVTHRYALASHSAVFDSLLNDPASPIVKGVFIPNPQYL